MNPYIEIVTKSGVLVYVMDTFHQEKNGVSPLRGFVSPYTRNICYAMLCYATVTHVYHFLVLPLAYSRDAYMDFDA